MLHAFSDGQNKIYKFIQWTVQFFRSAVAQSGQESREGCEADFIVQIYCKSVRHFFDKERSVGMNLKRCYVVEWTAAATGVSVRSVRNISLCPTVVKS